MQNHCTSSTEKVAEKPNNSKACLHDYKQVPRTNLARCQICGGVKYRQQKEHK